MRHDGDESGLNFGGDFVIFGERQVFEQSVHNAVGSKLRRGANDGDR